LSGQTTNHAAFDRMVERDKPDMAFNRAAMTMGL
jgi:hypothetical protein